jgi:hypothetical protein
MDDGLRSNHAAAETVARLACTGCTAAVRGCSMAARRGRDQARPRIARRHEVACIGRAALDPRRRASPITAGAALCYPIGAG